MCYRGIKKNAHNIISFIILCHCGTDEFISISLQVDETGEVVQNSWEDCQSDCPIEEQNIGDEIHG